MNLFKQFNPPKLFLLFYSTVFLSACAGINVESDQFSDDEACNRLQGLIKDHKKQFTTYRKSRRPNKFYTIWSAEKVFTKAENCQVWEWSTGLYNYACSWKAKEGGAQAKSNYDEDVRIIKNCLDNSWKPRITSTKSGGQHTLFSNDRSPTIVSIRYFAESKGFLENWYNTVVIGDKSNLNTPAQ